jgi:hypothetical protein
MEIPEEVKTECSIVISAASGALTIFPGGFLRIAWRSGRKKHLTGWDSRGISHDGLLGRLLVGRHGLAVEFGGPPSIPPCSPFDPALFYRLMWSCYRIAL